MTKQNVSNQALIALQEGKLEEAEHLYRSILNEQPEHIDANNNLGIILQNFGKLEEAKEYYKKAIKINPKHPNAHNNLGGLHIDLEEFKEAEKYFRKALELNPHYVEAHYNLGIVLYKLSKFEESILSYKKAIELKPDYIDALNNLGLTLQKLDRLDDAELNYRKVLNFKGNHTDALYNLDILLREKEVLSKIFQVRNFIKKSKASNISSTSILRSNPFITYRSVETDLIKDLYKINLTFKVLDNTTKEDARYGKGRCSDFKLFKNNSSIIKTVEEDLISIMKKAVNSDIYIMDSFLNIYGAGSGTIPHKHISNFDKNQELINQKFSLTYYLDVGDQNCDEPGNLKLYNPDEEILLSDGKIAIIPASRIHSAAYGGKTDRVMIGVNFYSLI